MDTKKTGDSEENIIEEEIRKTEIEFKDLLQQRRDLQKVLKTEEKERENKHTQGFPREGYSLAEEEALRDLDTVNNGIDI